MNSQVNKRTTQRLAQLSLRLYAMLQPHDGAIARPGVPEGECQGDQAGGVVDDGPHEEDEADEVGEEDAAAVALQDEGGRGRERL